MSEPIAAQLDAILHHQEILTDALLGSARPGSAPGLIRRMDAGEQDRADLRRMITELTTIIRTLEGAPGRMALGWMDRVAFYLLTMVLGGVGYMAGSFFTAHK